MFYGYYRAALQLSIYTQNIVYNFIFPGRWVLSLVIDVVQNKLYFPDGVNKNIQVANSDGTERKTLISDISDLKGICVNWITR